MEPMLATVDTKKEAHLCELPHEDHGVSDEVDTEEAILARMGYKQELNRGFNAFMSFAFSFTSVNVLSSFSTTFYLGLTSGGPAIMVYEWLLASLMTMLTGLALAEICSRYPSAGSVYHWAGVLAGPRYCAVASYIDGWFNFCGNLAGCSAFAYGFAGMISSALMLSGRAGMSEPVQCAVAIAALFSFVLVNLFRIGQQGYLYSTSVLFQLASAVGIALSLLILAPQRATPTFVFTATNDTTGFDNLAYASVLGILVPTYSMSGYEAGAHLAEETKEASRSAPMGILYCVICSAGFGFVYLLSLLFGITDMQAVNDSELGAAIYVFQNVLGTNGALIATCLLVVNLFFAGVSSMTVTSRVAYAMARDGALPFSAWTRQVKYNQLPVNAVLQVFLCGSLLLLLPIANSTAFAAITSITVIGYQISYAVPLWLRLTISRHSFVPSPNFSLGRFSRPIGTVAATWLTLTALLLLLPAEAPITAANMNYTVLVVLAVFVLAAANWVFVARFHYQGPLKALAEHNELQKH